MGVKMSAARGPWKLAVPIAAVAILTAACSVSVKSEAHAPSSTNRIVAPSTAATPSSTSPPSTTVAQPTTTSQSRMDPAQMVQTVGLTQADVGSNRTAKRPGKGMTRSSDPCKAVSSSPYLAGALSTVFAGPEPGYASIASYSQVAVEPSATTAKQVVASMSTNDWAQRCDEPSWQQDSQSSLDATNAQTDCAMTLHDPTETEIAADKLPAGVVGWQYTDTVHCALHDQDWSESTVTLIASEGRTVILLFVKTVEQPVAPGQTAPYTLEPADVQGIENMIARARSAQQL